MTCSFTRRTVPLVVATAVATATASVAPAWASHDVTPARVAGENRIETAAAIAALQYPDGTENVLLAKAGDFPDALAGAPLAGERDAPILLTFEDRLAPGTVDALQERGASTVTILGGPAAVNESVAEDLRDRGYTVNRISGANRFETAADLARAVQAASDNAANFPGGQRAVFVANGLRFPDALAAGAPAAAGPAEIPIVLVQPDGIPPATNEVLQELNVELAIIVGGTEAVSEEVRQQLEDQGINTDRVAGANRMETATAMAAFAQEFLGFDADTFLLARGDAFPDALAAGPRGGEQRNPILLTQDPTTLSQVTADYLRNQCTAVQVIRAVGGTSAVAPSTLSAAEQAAEECAGAHGGEDGQTFIVSPQQAVEVQAGEEFTFTVGARYDGQPFTGPVDVALFPCENANVTGTGPDTFTDADGDGVADGLGTTDTGAAVIHQVNDIPADGDPKVLRGLEPDADGTLDVTLRAQAADCTVIVFFQDADGDGQLDLDAEDTPTEPFGVGKITWS